MTLVAVVRPFLLDGRIVPAGSLVDLPDYMAGDLIARRRAEPAGATPAAPSSPPPDTEPVAALLKMPRRHRKGKHHAQ